MSQLGSPVNRVERRINLVCLVTAIVALCVFPQRKEIWYDETVSMLISKGIRHDTHFQFADADTISSTTLQTLNRPREVYRATIKDMGNSLPYNMALHWFTRLFGNEVGVYTLLSKLSSVATLLAFYVLANLLFGGSIATSLAIILLATDATFVLLSHEIRAYSLATLFLVLAGICLFRFVYGNKRPRELFLTGLFSAGAFLTHFLSVYVAVVFAACVLLTLRVRDISWKYAIAVGVPVLLVGVYMYSALAGLASLRLENETIRAGVNTPFILSDVLYRSAQIAPTDFRVVFPAFGGTPAVVLLSLLVVAALYVSALRLATTSDERRRLHVLFVLGVSGTVFLALVSVAAGHYKFLYYRYHSFGVPFGTLFTAAALATLLSSPKVTKSLRLAVAALVVIPCVVLYATLFRSHRPSQSFNHVAIAKDIANSRVAQVAVPEWTDALLLHALLPNGYAVRYLRNPGSRYFRLYEPNGQTRLRERIRL